MTVALVPFWGLGRYSLPTGPPATIFYNVIGHLTENCPCRVFLQRCRSTAKVVAERHLSRSQRKIWKFINPHQGRFPQSLITSNETATAPNIETRVEAHSGNNCGFLPKPYSNIYIYILDIWHSHTHTIYIVFTCYMYTYILIWYNTLARQCHVNP